MIDTQTNQVVGSPITGRPTQSGIAITPDGKTGLRRRPDRPTVLGDRHPDQSGGGLADSLGGRPRSIAVTPDGNSAYVTDLRLRAVKVINTRTDQVVGPTDHGRRLPVRDRDHA